MKRALAALVVVLVGAVAVYYFFVRDESVAPKVEPLALAGTIGSGEDAVAVNGRGEVLRWLAIPEDLDLPELPAEEAPKSGQLKGPMLQQARILAAVPTALRPYVARSSYGEDGVEVELDLGIDLHFGDASQAKRKWQAAAAVLASEEIEAVDYVDLHAPGKPATYGEGHLLPSLP